MYFCTVRGDLIKTLKKLYLKKNKFNHIIIETTGLADPAPVAQTFFIDNEIAAQFKLDSIVTFVDSKFIIQHLDEEKPDNVENEANEQVAFADLLVLNKVDLVDDNKLKKIELKLKTINIHAPIIKTTYSKLPIDKVININAFDLKKTIEMDEGFLDIESEHKHDNSISSFGIHIEGEFNDVKLGLWLQELLAEKGADIYRSKGIFAIKGSNEKYVFQAVHMLMDINSSSELNLNYKNWKVDEKRINKFCFIGKNLNKEQIIKELKKCLSNAKIPEPGPIPNTKLKYKLNDMVLCNCEDWKKGKIIKLWYRESLWPTGLYAPYQVLLENGTLIWIPRDSDVFIKSIS